MDDKQNPYIPIAGVFENFPNIKEETQKKKLQQKMKKTKVIQSKTKNSKIQRRNVN